MYFNYQCGSASFPKIKKRFDLFPVLTVAASPEELSKMLRTKPAPAP